jgi:hypothetical protein
LSLDISLGRAVVQTSDIIIILARRRCCRPQAILDSLKKALRDQDPKNIQEVENKRQ